MNQFLRLVVLSLLTFSLITVGSSQSLSDIPGIPNTESTTEKPVVELGRATTNEGLESPRDTLKTFLKSMVLQRTEGDGSWQVAARALDLDHVSDISFDTEARYAVNTLYDVINRIVWIEYDKYPGKDEVTASRWVLHEEPAFTIEMTRNELGMWRFSRSTVDNLDMIQLQVRDRGLVDGTTEISLYESPQTWLRNHLPVWFFDRYFILENYQWSALFLLILIGFALDRVTRLVVGKGASRYQGKLEFYAPEDIISQLNKWSGVAVCAMIWYIGTQIIGIQGILNDILQVALLVYATSSVVMLLLALTDFGAEIAQKKSAETPTKFDDILVPLIRKTAKTFIMIFGIIFIGDNLPGINITGFLAGLGIGGLAFALAAKDTVENLFGSVAILMDRPFEIGDWVIINEVEGTVENVGMRSTRIRTFYNSLITVPNSNLIKANVDNLGRRRYRRVKSMISVTYNTPPEKIDAYCEGIRELIRQHPYTRKDNYHVWLNEMGAHSLDILLYAFHEVPDWATELRERHRLLLDIIRLAHRLGIEFAFPTQTLYLEKGQGPAEPDLTPFVTRRDVMGMRAESREHVKEIVDKLLKDGSTVVPPPPVTFHMGPDAEELALDPHNRGGDSDGG